jgi:hypothetical protein
MSQILEIDKRFVAFHQYRSALGLIQIGRGFRERKQTVQFGEDPVISKDN